MNWNKFKCRCSAISKLLTNGAEGRQITANQLDELKKLEEKESRTDKQEAEMQRLMGLKANSGRVVLGDTAIEYLMEVYAWEKYSMIAVGKEALDVIQMRKGKMVEAESVALISRLEGVNYLVNKERVENEYLTGEVDMFLGESIYAATNVTDMKNAFDMPTFLKMKNRGLLTGQREQMQGYGDITGAQELFIAVSLVSLPPDMVDDLKWRVMRKLNCATEESPEFKEIWPLWEHSSNFDKIPIHHRIHKKKVEPFTEFERQKVYDRVKYAREWLQKFDEEHSKFIKWQQ